MKNIRCESYNVYERQNGVVGPPQQVSLHVIPTISFAVLTYQNYVSKETVKLEAIIYIVYLESLVSYAFSLHNLFITNRRQISSRLFTLMVQFGLGIISFLKLSSVKYCKLAQSFSCYVRMSPIIFLFVHTRLLYAYLRRR